eukprot:3339039-Amphidinium_carterae.1
MEMSLLQMEAAREKDEREMESLTLQQGGMSDVASMMQLERDRAAEAARSEAAMEEVEAEKASALQEALKASFREARDAENRLD